jgi:predicted deacylase
METTATLGQSIRQGELLGRIYNIFGQAVDEIFAMHDGVVAGIRAFPTIRAGEWSIFIGIPNLEAGYGQEEIQ